MKHKSCFELQPWADTIPTSSSRDSGQQLKVEVSFQCLPSFHGWSQQTQHAQRCHSVKALRSSFRAGGGFPLRAEHLLQHTMARGCQQHTALFDGDLPHDTHAAQVAFGGLLT